MEKINITELKDHNFVGYYWLSDERKPRVLNGEDASPVWKYFQEDVNPFIVEAMLVDKTNPELWTSYTIRNVDGETIVLKYDNLPAKPDDTHTEVAYIPNRMGLVGKLVFYQEWVKRADPMCEGMDVLEPGALIFVGFEK